MAVTRYSLKTPTGVQAVASAGANYYVADTAAELTSGSEGDLGYAKDTNTSYVYTTAWVAISTTGGGGTTVNVAAAGALGGDGSGGDPLAVLVDGVTMTINGSNQLESSAASTEWTTEVVKGSDQSVTNSTTLVNDTELLIAMTAGDIWYVELLLIYTCNDAARDFAFNFGLPNAYGWHRYISAFNSADSLAQSTGVQLSNATSIGSDLGLGGDAGATNRVHFHQFYIRASSSANFQFKFANGLANAANTCTVKTGSVLRGKKLIP